jgi:WD40 repeat protein
VGTFTVRLEPARVALKAGERVRLQVAVERKGYDGPIQVRLEWLPHGVTCQPQTLEAGVNEVEMWVVAERATQDITRRATFVATAGDRLPVQQQLEIMVKKAAVAANPAPSTPQGPRPQLTRPGRGKATAGQPKTTPTPKRAPTPDGAVASLPDSAQCVAFSPTGEYVAAGSETGLVYLMDVESGSVRKLNSHVGEVTHVAFAPDGSRLYSAGKDGRVRAWKVDDEKDKGTEILAAAAITCFALTPDGGRLVAGHLNGTAHLYDVATGKELRRFGNRPKSVRTVAVTPDALRCLVGYDGSLSEVNSIDLYNLESGKLLAEYRGHSRAVYCAAFSHDNRRMLSGGADGTVRLWDLRGEAKELRGFRDPELKAAVTAVAFVPGDRQAVTVGMDGFLRVWDVESGKPASPAKQVHSAKGVVALAVSADGRLAVSANKQDGVRIWRLAE